MKPAIITISRQFGSGGREISAELSQRIGIPCYEKALFEEASRNSGIHQLFFEQAEGTHDRLFAHGSSVSFGPLNMSLDDRMFVAQAETIRSLAQQGPCIIVGRGANRILRDRGDVLNIFIYAEKDIRLKRAVEAYHVPEKQAERALNAIDKSRAAYLKYYTDQMFGKTENYHLCIDSGKIGIENSVQVIEAAYRTLE